MTTICYDIQNNSGEIVNTGEYDLKNSRVVAQNFTDALCSGLRVRTWRKGESYTSLTQAVADFPPRMLELTGKRWFQKSYGNTYFTARAVLDGEVIAECPRQYGYGDQWKQELIREIEASGKLTPRNQNELAREWAERIGVTLVENVTDVTRERDL